MKRMLGLLGFAVLGAAIASGVVWPDLPKASTDESLDCSKAQGLAANRAAGSLRLSAGTAGSLRAALPAIAR